MPLIDTPVAELEYAEDGDPAGTPVVLVHGFPDIPATWEQVVPRLPPGLRIIRPYLRGYGGSRVRAEAWDEAGGAQVAALATDLLDLLDALSLDRVVLAGHDWGARTAHAATVLAPERISASRRSMESSTRAALPGCETAIDYLRVSHHRAVRGRSRRGKFSLTGRLIGENWLFVHPFRGPAPAR